MSGLEPHATEELVLLYCAQFGARYLRAFLDMAERPPQVGLAEPSALSGLVALALERSGHLWFLTDEPHLYDRGQELLARAASQRTIHAATAPEEALALPPEEVRYYRNPLDRLRHMHQSATEMVTGFTYVSPWS